MNTLPAQRLRADEQTVQTVLERLDRAVRPPRSVDLRTSDRYAYRQTQFPFALLNQDGEQASPCAAATRNLSRGGLGLLTNQFIYPRTRCQVTLQSQYGHVHGVIGRVVRCRYLTNSHVLYEVGMQFDRPVDVELYAPQARTMQVLLVDQSTAIHDLVSSFLEPHNVELTCVTSTLDAVTVALSSEFDLILLDLENDEYDAFLVTRELRRSGYLGPIVGLAVQTDQALELRCIEAGCTGYLPKPLHRDALIEVVRSLREEPLLSTLADDPDLAGLINDFVSGLRLRAKALSVAFETDHLDAVRELARSLRSEAGSYGFQPITDEAEHVQALAALETPPPRLRPALYDLIHLCLSARPVPCEEDEWIDDTE